MSPKYNPVARKNLLKFIKSKPSGCNRHPELRTDLRIIQEMLDHKSSRTTEIYPDGNCYPNRQRTINSDFSNGVNTHVSMKNLMNVKNPLDDFGGIV